VDIVADAPLVEQLIELLVVHAMRALDLAIQPGCSWPDVDMADVEFLQVPVKP
jgi:hypothetical protein